MFELDLDELTIDLPDVTTDDISTSPNILDKQLELADVELMDGSLDMEEAISLLFLTVAHKPDKAIRLTTEIEQLGRNEVKSKGLNKGEGLVQAFWQSFHQKPQENLWIAKICEGLYRMENHQALEQLGITPQDAEKIFENSYLDPWALKLYMRCRETTLKEQKQLEETLEISTKYSVLEAQLLFYISEHRITLEECHRRVEQLFTQSIQPPPSRVEGGGGSSNQYSRGPGFVLIINQKQFYWDESNPESRRGRGGRGLENRLGTDMDRDRLKIAFTYLGASQFRIYNDLNTAGVDKALDDTVRYLNEKSSEYSWVCVCFLSHGSRSACGTDEVYACDSVPLDRKKILMRFADKKSLPNFEGKPKILIFQACRTMEDGQTPAPPPPQRSNEDIQTDGGYKTISIDDYLECSSTIEDFVTFRSTSLGSFYIRILCDQLMKEGHREDLNSILITVNGKMKEIRDYPSMPTYSSTLTKKLYFQRSKESLSRAAELFVHDVNFRDTYHSFISDLSPHNNLD